MVREDEDALNPCSIALIYPLQAKMIKFPCGVHFQDEHTDDGLVRLINKCKPLIKDIEARGFCACGEGEHPCKRMKIAGIDQCGKCAFKAALST